MMKQIVYFALCFVLSLIGKMGTETESYMDLRAELHLRLLKGELSHTDDELQTLR